MRNLQINFRVTFSYFFLLSFYFALFLGFYFTRVKRTEKENKERKKVEEKKHQKQNHICEFLTWLHTPDKLTMIK